MLGPADVPSHRGNPPDFVGHQEGTVRSQVAGVNKVAHAREGGWSTDLPRFHLREDVTRADVS